MTEYKNASVLTPTKLTIMRKLSAFGCLRCDDCSKILQFCVVLI